MYEEGDSYIAPGDTSALFDDLDQDDDFFQELTKSLIEQEEEQERDKSNLSIDLNDHQIDIDEVNFKPVKKELPNRAEFKDVSVVKDVPVVNSPKISTKKKKVISEYHEKLEEQKELENFLKGIDEKNSQGSSTGTGTTAPTAANKPVYYHQDIVPQQKVTEKQSLELRQAFVQTLLGRYTPLQVQADLYMKPLPPVIG